jgi:plastocyanin
MRLVALLSLLALTLAHGAPARAEDAATFRIEFNDGKFEPQALQVPAGKTIEIELVNKGQSPAEFESKQLRKEKVLAPGATTTLVIRGLDPGEYEFFDDFHPEAPPAKLIAK